LDVQGEDEEPVTALLLDDDHFGEHANLQVREESSEDRNFSVCISDHTLYYSYVSAAFTSVAVRQ
jgi:hypothetical protein